MNDKFLQNIPKLCSGNEAIAIGAIAAGITSASGYPGAPCSEVMETIAYINQSGLLDNRVFCQWSVNEKVALEVGIGVSFAGKRTMVLMKTLGLNVAADAFFQMAGTQLNGGLVMVVADDVGRIVGDDYEDCRNYAIAAGVPLLEPANSHECFVFMLEAFRISETYSSPVILRLNSTTCLSRSLINVSHDDFIKNQVTVNKYEFSGIKTFSNTIQFSIEKNTESELSKKYVFNYKDQWNNITSYADSSSINNIEFKSPEIGFITTGVAHHYTKEVFPEASYLKLGLGYPLPEKKLEQFFEKVEKVIVIEQTHSLIEKEIKAKGYNVHGRDILPLYPTTLHLTPDYIKEKVNTWLYNKQPEKFANNVIDLPNRPVSNCPGCSHLFIYQATKKLKLKVASGIGCCAIGCSPQIQSVSIIKCMGAPPGMNQGYNIAKNSESGKDTEEMISVMGDGEFWHTGIMGIMNSKINNIRSTTLVVDNGVVAMTGAQNAPSSSFNIYKQPQQGMSIEHQCRSLGFSTRLIDPYNFEELESIIKEELSKDTTSVIVASHECQQLAKNKTKNVVHLDSEKCTMCKKCIDSGCMAIHCNNGKIEIYSELCVGCGLCSYLCTHSALLVKNLEKEVL